MVGILTFSGPLSGNDLMDWMSKRAEGDADHDELRGVGADLNGVVF